MLVSTIAAGKEQEMKLPGFTAIASLGRCGIYVGSVTSVPGDTSAQPAQVMQPPKIDYWWLGPWLRPHDPCIYGNYCGPGCSGPGAPIDALDTCCKKHDDCYTEKGYFDCECDKQLLKCIAEQSFSIVTDGPNPVVGATLLSTYFALQYMAHCVLITPVTETAKAIGEAWHNPLTTIKKAVTDLPNPLTEVGKAWHTPFETIGKGAWRKLRSRTALLEWAPPVIRGASSVTKMLPSIFDR